MSGPDVDSAVPAIRIRLANSAAARTDGEFVLYWMSANRRMRWNYSLERAVDWARALRKPLVVFEALRCDYGWASDRFHRFVIQGMGDNARRFTKAPVTYYPFVEQREGQGRGLLRSLAERACVVVGDDFPCFFLPRMAAAAAGQIRVRFELVDSNGLLPMRAAGKVFARAFDFRRFMQRELREHLVNFPKNEPLKRVRLPRLDRLPAAIIEKWPVADVAKLSASAAALSAFPIDHSVEVAAPAGGAIAAEKRLASFLDTQLSDYELKRNHPDHDATSGLSPYLHFGQLSAHEVFMEIAGRENWSPAKLAGKVTGSSHGWWGMGASAEAFLDQLVTWRELGFNMCSKRDDFDRYESLPIWARTTLAEHAADPREFVYSLAEFEQAATHDPLWNAAQRQLMREGRIHNYLRMLWGKKILEWTASPEESLAVMIELNNKYALDGRDPNSYSGIFWILGRYDRAWGPERPIFGKVRYMSSANTIRKLHVEKYLETYGTGP
jgi:deoxyribodipyrimidine photo-lyase